jgi:hypothetical protein
MAVRELFIFQFEGDNKITITKIWLGETDATRMSTITNMATMQK